MLKNLFSRKNWFTIANVALTLVAIVLMVIAFRPPQRVQSVIPPYDKDWEFHCAGFKVEQKARLEGAKDWDSFEVADVRVGDVVQFQTQYQNWDEETQYHVIMSLSWTKGLEFVPDSVRFYNANCPDGISVPDPVLTYYADGGTGFDFDLGSYTEDANTYLRFSAVITEIEPWEGRACFATVKNDGISLTSTAVIKHVKPALDSTMEDGSAEPVSNSTVEVGSSEDG